MKNILKNNSGDVGIGTLIVFIAMVLVAAVAAAVLIQTSGVLQQKAQTTGTEATAEVSSNIKIVSIVGTDVDTDGTDIDQMKISIALSAGGDPIDMAEVVVKYLDDSNVTTHSLNDSMVLTGTADTPIYFKYAEDRSVDGVDNDVLSSGDLGYITLYINTSTGAYQDLAKRGTGKIILMPETGTSVIKDVTAPATFKGKTEVQLFP